MPKPERTVVDPWAAIPAAKALHERGFDTNLNTGEVIRREPDAQADDEQGGVR